MPTRYYFPRPLLNSRHECAHQFHEKCFGTLRENEEMAREIKQTLLDLITKHNQLYVYDQRKPQNKQQAGKRRKNKGKDEENEKEGRLISTRYFPAFLPHTEAVALLLILTWTRYSFSNFAMLSGLKPSSGAKNVRRTSEASFFRTWRQLCRRR